MYATYQLPPQKYVDDLQASIKRELDKEQEQLSQWESEGGYVCSY